MIEIFDDSLMTGTSVMTFSKLTFSEMCGKVAWFCQIWGIHRVSVQGVESLWGDCRFIPADWGL